MCAGVTVFSPLIHFNPPKGAEVGVVGKEVAGWTMAIGACTNT